MENEEGCSGVPAPEQKMVHCVQCSIACTGFKSCYMRLYAPDGCSCNNLLGAGVSGHDGKLPVCMGRDCVLYPSCFQERIDAGEKLKWWREYLEGAK
jgi:hypothetical protein